MGLDREKSYLEMKENIPKRDPRRGIQGLGRVRNGSAQSRMKTSIRLTPLSSLPNYLPINIHTPVAQHHSEGAPDLVSTATFGLTSTWDVFPSPDFLAHIVQISTDLFSNFLLIVHSPRQELGRRKHDPRRRFRPAFCPWNWIVAHFQSYSRSHSHAL